MRKKFVVFKKLCNFAPENIVEPFKERKGQTNEYKVSYIPSEHWQLQPVGCGII